MFKKLLNVGKGHLNDKQQQQQQQNQKDLFQLNEIRSYGFSQLSCLGYSASLSLLAVGSKQGLLRVLGTPSVEFSHQLDNASSIRQIELIDCRHLSSSSTTTTTNGDNKSTANQVSNESKTTGGDTAGNNQQEQISSTPAKIVCVTDNGQLHLLEFKTVKHYHQVVASSDATPSAGSQATDGATQTNDGQLNGDNDNSMVIDSNNLTATIDDNSDESTATNDVTHQLSEYTRLDKVATLEYFADPEFKSRRVTTIEITLDSRSVLVGTVGGTIYQIDLDNFVDPAPASGGNVSGTDVSNADVSDTNLDTNEDDNVVATDSVDDKKKEQQLEEPARPDNELEKSAIYYDKLVAPSLAAELRAKKSGPVEAIKRHPSDANKVLVGYQRGLCLVFDLSKRQVDRYYYYNDQLLESAAWAPPSDSSSSSQYFYTAHNDGSYVRWTYGGSSGGKSAVAQLAPNNDDISQVFGPYPSKPIMKISSCKAMNGDQLEDLVIFSGGMPRASYDDKNPVTIVRSSSSSSSSSEPDSIKQVLDFTSKVLDFAIITRAPSTLSNSSNQQRKQQQSNRNQVAVALAVLAEEELVVIDLLFNSSHADESYLEFALPYLNCVHSSAITCNQHYSDISGQLYDQICAYNQRQLRGKFSPNEWPISGGKIIEISTTGDISSNSASTLSQATAATIQANNRIDTAAANQQQQQAHDILLTGHEDGSVHFWDVSGLSMKHLLHLSTAKYFVCQDDMDLAPIDGDSSSTKDQQQQDQQTATNGWPPMKRVGQFDPYSDDARLAIRKFALCPNSGNLVVVGTAGQVLVFELNDETREQSIKVNDVQLISPNDGPFVWKGQPKLNTRQGIMKLEPGYQLVSFVQLSPPAMVTALDARPDWGLFTAGTSHGFVLFDYVNHTPIVTKCTLNAHDFALVRAGDDPNGTAISRRKSFRKSLRESFRRLRKGRSQRATPAAPNSASPSTGGATGGVTSQARGGRTLQRPAMVAPSIGGGGGERSVDARAELNSIVRCLSLTPAIISAQAQGRASASLWVGTQAGLVLVYAIKLSPKPSAQLAKEIQLKHKAPVIAMFVTPSNLPVEYPPVEHVATSASDSTPTVETAQDSNVSPAKSTDSQEQQKSGKTEAAVAPKTAERAAEQTPSSGSRPAPAAGAGTNEQARVLICSEEQFKVFNLPNLKPFCKFKLTAHEGLRAKKINITQLVRPAPVKCVKSSTTQTINDINGTVNGRAASPTALTTEANNNNNVENINNNNVKQQIKSSAKLSATADGKEVTLTGGKEQQVSPVEMPYMVCMSNQGDCAIYSVPDLKRQAQIQVCKREDVNGITSTILTQYGEGFYLRSTSDFLRFSISSQRVLRCLSVV